MDEIATALNNIAEVLSTGELPLWLTASGIIAPILLTGITIVLSMRMDRQNKKLQKQIHNRDVVNQTRQTILDVYHSFLNAHDVTQMPGPCVASVYVSDQSYYQWALAVEAASKELMFSFNTAKLLLKDDKELIAYLKKCWLAFAEIDRAINKYNTSGAPAQTVSAAWESFGQKYGIHSGDYSALLRNPMWGEEFKRFCDNAHTQEIQCKIGEYQSLVANDKFDDIFRKYIQIQTFE